MVTYSDNSVKQNVNMKKGRTIAIGDIHGCATAFLTLLDAIALTPEDTVVTLGDYVDRGPDSHGVVKRLLQLQSECSLVALRGNHEAMLLDALDSDFASRFWLQCGGLATLTSYMTARDQTESTGEIAEESTGETPSELSIDMRVILPQHIEFFRSCTLAYETDEHLFLHANYDPKLPIDEQEEACLLWQHLQQIPAPHVSGKTVFVGHTPQTNGEVLDAGHLVCLDTFCFGGGWLTAMDVHSRMVWQANDSGEVRESC